MKAKFFTLSNGIKSIFIKNKSTKTITLLVWVNTGSKYETKEISGISHFLEHMMFKGTKKRKDAHAITVELDSVGAEFNAFTSQEYTGYYIQTVHENFDLAADVLSDIILNSKFDKREMDKERGVIIEELNMYKDNPPRQVLQNFEHLLYGDQPAGWDIGGTKESVLSISRKQLVDYFKDQYKANNTIICLAGNFDEKKAKEKLECLFAGMQEGKIRTKPEVIEKQTRPGLNLEYKKTDQTHLVLGFRSFIPFSDDKIYPLYLLSVILGGGMSSRLFVNIREKQGLAYYISSGVEATSDTGYLYIRAGVDNKRVLNSVKSILSEIRKVLRRGITKEELSKAKKYKEGKLLMGLESSYEMASLFTHYFAYGKRLKSEDEILKKIFSVTESDVNDLAKEIFKNERLNLALIGPFKKKSEFEEVLKF